jgi:hypothetical protein
MLPVLSRGSGMSTAFPIPRSDRRIDLAAAASQTVFTFPYPTLENQDVGVAVQAPAATQFTTLIYGLDYTVSGAPSSTGVTVTVTAPAVSGAVYRLTGARTPSRTTSLAPYGTSYRAALECVLAGKADVTSVFASAPMLRSARQRFARLRIGAPSQTLRGAVRLDRTRRATAASGTSAQASSSGRSMRARAQPRSKARA